MKLLIHSRTAAMHNYFSIILGLNLNHVSKIGSWWRMHAPVKEVIRGSGFHVFSAPNNSLDQCLHIVDMTPVTRLSKIWIPLQMSFGNCRLYFSGISELNDMSLNRDRVKRTLDSMPITGNRPSTGHHIKLNTETTHQLRGLSLYPPRNYIDWRLNRKDRYPRNVLDITYSK